MPKAAGNKKRKKDGNKNEKPKAKKTKLDDCEGINSELVVEDKTSSSISDVSCQQREDVVDIDELLDKNAAKNNLTAINVKSIIHHVVTDKRVLALVQSAMDAEKSQEDEVSSANGKNTTVDLQLDFAPKMTRAKSKQAAQGDPIMALASQSPIKELRSKVSSRSKKLNFTELELPESSSDEEYNPDEEEERSDEDTESCVSFASDLASPKIPETPESHKPDVPNTADDSPTAHTVTRSLSKRLFQEPFKLPYPVVPTSSSIPLEEPCPTISSEEGDLIARRTRSQFPLLDTPIETIEATFQAPDFTPDMYDIIQEEDLDFDEIEWQKWLQGLINADNDDTFGEDDHEDTEYNFMAEEQKEEKEEYRNDRAVRIPQKEVNELMEELLKDYNGDADDVFCTDEETSDMFFLDVISPSCGRVRENIQLFNSHQLKQLSQQLQQHTQLLTQIFIMAHEEPSLNVEANLARDYVNELKGFSDRASNAQLIRGLGDGLVHSSAFSFPGLEQAVTIVNDTFITDGATPSKAKSIRKAKSTKSLHEDLLRPLSETSIATMASSPEVFRFLELLPYCNLLPRTGDTPKLLRGLRVKFYEAEDTLLALGLQQFDKQWDLIQQHLLPVKTPKQLQNRCKNLLSSRAPENIIKYYRRNKRLWDLPDIIESPGRRQWGRDSLEPEWLTDYRKKQKETREKEEKRELLVVQQSAEPATFGRPIVPKIHPHACPFAVQSGPSSADQVAWVAITGVSHPWGAVTTTQPRREVEDSSTTHPTPVVSVDKDVANASTIKVTQPSSKEPPAENTAVEVDEQPTELPTIIEPAVQMEENGSGEEGCPPTSEETAPSTTTKITCVDSNKENQSEEATEKPAPDHAPKKPTSTAAKAKPLRDKSLAGATAGRVTSRSHCAASDGSGGNASVTSRKTAPHSQTNSVGNYILEPDPKFRDRAQAFAEAFLAKVKKQLKEDPETYEEFLRTLSTSSSEQCSPVELYRRVEVVLVQYPDLVEDFVGFLEPHQAVEAGVFMANLEFVRARTFLRKLEVHFQKSPSHFRKIINAFDSWRKNATKDPAELQQTIIPMLKGQQHLIEELCSFFDDMKPPACSDDDFEEVEFGSGSEPEVDDFEEVVIPCFVEQKKIKVKGRPVKATQKAGVKNPTGKTNTTRKPAANVKGAKQQGTASKMAGNRTKRGSSAGKNSASEGKKIVEGQGAPRGEHPKTPPNALRNSVNSGGSDGHDPQKTEVNALEGPLSTAATSLQSKASSDRCRGEEFPATAPDTLSTELEEQDRRSSYSEEQEDDVNTDVENSPRDDGYEEEEYDYDDADVEREAVEYPDDVTSCDVDSDVTGGDFNTDVITNDVDADTGTGCDSDVVMLPSEAVVPAKNLHRTEDGRLVIAWTREDDREILQACQKMGASKGTFQHVANVLHDKTADEVEKRFVDLMNLFKASTGAPARESMNEESGSEDEEEEDSDAVVESEGEQDNAE